VKTFSLAFLLVGAVVGAGFASGREILSFFGDSPSIFIAPLVGAVFFFGSILFLSVGAKVKADNITAANLLIMGNKHIIADILLLFNGVIMLGGMLAAMNSLFNMLLPLSPLYAFMAGILCAILVARGLKGLLKCNAILTPIVIAIMIVICIFAILRSDGTGSQTIFFAPNPLNYPMILIYMSMNMMLASTVLTTIHTFNKRQIMTASFLASIVIAGLMAVLIFALNSSSDYYTAMPLVSMALSSGPILFYFAIAAIGVSIFTSMMTAMIGLDSWLKPITGGKWYSIVIVLISGLILSMLGFETVVAFLYPVIGVLGLVYIVWCIVYLAKNRKKDLTKDKSI